MKARLLLFIFLLASAHSNAQNWQCFPDAAKHYFTNNNHYLRCSYASKLVFPDSTCYFPFCTLRGPYNTAIISGTSYPPNSGANWLGDSVIMMNDGTFLFHSALFDTVRIRTRASAGDSWMFYDDTSIHAYRATVLSMDTMTVLGSFDSVKTIQITALSSGILDTSSPLNGLQIILGKSSGFIQVFDLYNFPYRFPFYADYFYDNVGSAASNQIFHLFNYHNPTALEVYDFVPGDVFERRTTASNYWVYPCDGHDTYNALFIDSVAARIIIDATHINYLIHHTGHESTAGITINYDQIDTIVVTSSGFYTNYVPESCNDYMCYYFYPSDASWCTVAPVHRITGPGFGFTDFSGYCTEDETYKEGLGLVSRTRAHPGGVSCDEVITSYRYENLIFSFKNGDSCGHFESLYPAPVDTTASVKNQYTQSAEFSLFPNPASTTLTVSGTDKITRITISNLLGQELLSSKFNASQVHINVASLPIGVYLIRINGAEVRRFVKE